MPAADAQVDNLVSYRPRDFYLRQMVYDAQSLTQARQAALVAIEELARLKDWVRQRGMIPPKFLVLPQEQADRICAGQDPIPFDGPEQMVLALEHGELRPWDGA